MQEKDKDIKKQKKSQLTKKRKLHRDQKKLSKKNRQNCFIDDVESHENQDDTEGLDDNLLGKRDSISENDNKSDDDSEILLSQTSNDIDQTDKLRVSLKSNIPDEFIDNSQLSDIKVIVTCKQNRHTFIVGEKQIKYYLFKDFDNEAIISLCVVKGQDIIHTEKITKKRIAGNLSSFDWICELNKINENLQGNVKVMLKIEKNIVAEVLEVEDKTISDYQYFVKTGRKLKFPFNANIDEKMIKLRTHVKDNKSSEGININFDENKAKKGKNPSKIVTEDKRSFHERFSTIDPEVASASQGGQFYDNQSLGTSMQLQRMVSINPTVFGGQSINSNINHQLERIYGQNR